MDKYYDKDKRIQLRVSQQDKDRIALVGKHFSSLHWYNKDGNSAALIGAVDFYVKHHKLKEK